MQAVTSMPSTWLAKVPKAFQLSSAQMGSPAFIPKNPFKVQSRRVHACASRSQSEGAGSTAQPAWFTKPTAPEADLIDGDHFRDVFMLPKVWHVAATFSSVAALLAVAWVWRGDLRWQFPAWCVPTALGALAEGWMHYSTWSFHRIHRSWTLMHIAFSSAFLAAGGLQAMLRGPRDILFAAFVLLFPFVIYAAAGSYFMSIKLKSSNSV